MVSTALRVAPVVTLVGNPRAGSRTRALADAVTAALIDRLDPGAGTPTVLELAEIVGVTFGATPAPAVTPAVDAFATVRAARLLVVATPTYKGTYTGLLKIFLDQLPHEALRDAVAVPVAVAASEPHRFAVGAALHDVLVALGARVPAPPLALLESRAGTFGAAARDWAATHAAALGGALR
ncbi:NADPH-dependent FMN reductase [Asanoa siamensis]|uniref:FMN reductase n=1 Tax=Asanoa siamensis TaxID=926357 RepID=A0ABQ4D071_9ACTN|nr:NAD(P)H-dependent oxidoreductase [Asanoa siamensis]GIF76944.1 FMN reductase [Asanoa siamensis]